MFYYIEGTVSLFDNGISVLDCGGVGYALNTTANTQSKLVIGERARLYVYTVIREDCFDLYGFATLEEKRSFELLLGVSGVGPKAAQAILSSNTPESFAMAVLTGNEKALTCAPGIGKKIAQRILLELKDRMSKESETLSVPAGGSAGVAGGQVRSDKLSDAAAALTVLGYGNAEISEALKNLDPSSLSVEDMIRQALRRMMK